MSERAPFAAEWKAAHRLRERAVESVIAERQNPNAHQPYYSDSDADADLDGYLAIARLIGEVAELHRKLATARNAGRS